MAKVVLECVELELKLEAKILVLEEGRRSRLGRCHQNENVSCSNGLLPYNFLAVSYKHAFIVYSNGEFYLEDYSRNGTYLNGHRLKKKESIVLASGDILQLGGETYFSPIEKKDDVLLPIFFIKLFKPSDNDFEYMTKIKESYTTPLHLYERYPTFSFSLDSLHECTRERLKVLQILESIGDINCYEEGTIHNFLKQLKEETHMTKLVIGSSMSYEEEYLFQIMDHVSHYIISLSCCQNYVLKKWFIDQEVKLFQIRWHFLTDYEKQNVIRRYNYQNGKVSEEDKVKLHKESNGFVDPYSDLYKVSVLKISQLMKRRSVYVQNGFCFVPTNGMVFALATDFINVIKRNLKLMHTNLHHIWQDERITSIISYVKKEVKFERFLFDNRSGSTIILSQLDKLARESFPLCMSLLHYYLKKHNHLKNGGRFQYGLFLKGIGLSLQDSLIFWRHYFTKKMSLDEFINNYQYHILHSYGATGKMADYPPHSCKKILEAVPSYGEYHGCPYKILGEENTSYLLKKCNISEEGISNILKIKKEETPHLACKKYFELTHKEHFNGSLCHPVQYFEESRKIKAKENRNERLAECRCSGSKELEW